MNYETIIEFDNIALEDCEDLYNNKGICIVVSDGHITNLMKE